MRKYAMAAVLVATMASIGMVLAGCGTSGSDSSTSGGDVGYVKIQFEKKSPVKLGYSTQDLSNPYWQNYAKGVEAGAKAADRKSV